MICLLNPPVSERVEDHECSRYAVSSADSNSPSTVKGEARPARPHLALSGITESV